jgi:Cu(I)/Ag(I) efflux system membrane protein CusA/SilA
VRALQDWFLKFELKSLPNVAEVASVGGMVKQYQVVIDPIKLASTDSARAGPRAGERQPGNRRLRTWSCQAPNTWCRASGYLKTLEDFRAAAGGARRRAGAPGRRGHAAR